MEEEILKLIYDYSKKNRMIDLAYIRTQGEYALLRLSPRGARKLSKEDGAVVHCSSAERC